MMALFAYILCSPITVALALNIIEYRSEVQENTKSVSQVLHNTTSARSALECGITCLQAGRCDSVNYKDGECHLLQEDGLSQLTASEGWKYVAFQRRILDSSSNNHSFSVDDLLSLNRSFSFNDSSSVNGSSSFNESASFNVVFDLMNWHDAQINCLFMGGHLAEPIDNQTQQFISDLYQEQGLTVWLGATENVHGQWLWTRAGESVALSDPGWIPGQPDASGVDECMCYTQLNQGTGWNDGNCSALIASVCRLDRH